MGNFTEFACEAGSFTIDAAINGQTPLAFYDSIKQVALKPSLREGVIMPYEEAGLAGLFSQIQSLIKADNRTVTANEFFWLEYESYDTVTFTIKKANAAGAAGAAVTFDLAKSSMSNGGIFSKPRAGYRAYVKEAGHQAVDIIAVSKPAGAHTVQLRPINGEIIDFTKYGTYTLIIDPMRLYQRGTTDEIQTGGVVKNPPMMHKGYIQKWEDGIDIHEDEIDNYVYDRDFMIFKGMSPSGKPIEQFYIPAVNEELETRVMDSRNINTLIGRRNDIRKEGVDGLVPTAEKYGMFNAGYDVSADISFKSILWTMVKSLRKVNGCKQYMLAHDFGFGMDWTESFAALIKASNQSFNYELFGTGGEGDRNFKWYGFKDFEIYGYEFRTFMVDGFDHKRYAAMLQDFAIMLPLTMFKDHTGKTVPMFTYVNLTGSEPAKQKSMWIDDSRERGLRKLRGFVKDSYGHEIHAATKMGLLRKTPTK